MKYAKKEGDRFGPILGGRPQSRRGRSIEGRREVRVTPTLDLASYMQGWQSVSVSLGYDGKAYVLLAEKEANRRHEAAAPETACRYKVLVADPGGAAGTSEDRDPVEEIPIEDETQAYHYVQPLGDELLLAGSRSRYDDRERYEMNAGVFGRGGKIRRRFLLGDGIRSVQTTAGGLIWTAFSDEGVWGTGGWEKDRPVGESGLIAWDSRGIRVFTNSEAHIMDCYALNVVSDEEVWFYYYKDFRLCRLSGPAAQPAISFLDPQLEGSSIVMTDGRRFLMDNGYGEREHYTLLREAEPGRLVADGTIVLVDEEGRLGSGMRDARGGTLLLMDKTNLYRVTLDDVE